MKICRQGETLHVSELKELGLANCTDFSAQMRNALTAGARLIVIDLSATSHLDCSGLGALVALLKNASNSQDRVSVQLVNPTAHIRHLSKLTNLDHLFETSKSGLQLADTRP